MLTPARRVCGCTSTPSAAMRNSARGRENEDATANTIDPLSTRSRLPAESEIIMRGHRWFVGGILGGLAWIWLALGSSKRGRSSRPTPRRSSWTPAQRSACPSISSIAPCRDGHTQLAVAMHADRHAVLPRRDQLLPSRGRQERLRGHQWFDRHADSGATRAGARVPLADGALNPFVAKLTTSAYPGQFINMISTGTDADAEFGAATCLRI